REDSFHIIDLDATLTGPAIQDPWIMPSGDGQDRLRQLSEPADGYEELREYKTRELPASDGLRRLRLMHHRAWLARRWDDPAFPPSFPWFASERYWGDQILTLREQLAALDEEPLRLY